MSKKKQKSLEELLEEALVPEEEQPYIVPKNWVWTRTCIIHEIVTGATPSKKNNEYYGGNFPFVKPGDLDQEDSVIVASEYLTDKGKEVSRIIPKHSTLVCCIGSIGKTGFNLVECTTNQQINSLIPNKKVIYPKYTYYFSLSSTYQNLLLKSSSSTTVSIINKSKMSKLPFALPPLNEQKRIAEKIERLFAKIDEAKRLIEEVKESFELRRAAILDKAFKGQLGTNDPNEKSMFETSNHIKEKDLIPKEEQPYEVPKNWVWVKTGAIFEQIKEQVLPIGNETYVGLEHLIKGGGISHIELAKDIKSKKVVFKKGDVLYGKLRPYLNKHAIVDFDGVASTDILVFRTEHKYLNQLLDYYLGLPSTIDYAVSNSNGINLPRVSPKKMNDLPFPLPPKNEWKKIVKILDKMLNNLIEEQTLIEQLEAELVSIKNSILYKAFRGELGTNDPADEHAIELLKEVLKSK